MQVFDKLPNETIKWRMLMIQPFDEEEKNELHHCV